MNVPNVRVLLFWEGKWEQQEGPAPPPSPEDSIAGPFAWHSVFMKRVTPLHHYASTDSLIVVLNRKKAFQLL